MFAKYKRYTAGILTTTFAVGVVLAFGSQIITSRQTIDTRSDICSGPTVATYTCPGILTRITHRGYPLHFITDSSSVKVGGYLQGAASVTPTKTSTIDASSFLLDSLVYFLVITGLVWLLSLFKRR